jgi:hypothetical protein
MKNDTDYQEINISQLTPFKDHPRIIYLGFLFAYFFFFKRKSNGLPV